ncbi:27766_t:CDS:2, partial [Dentiscutata erythropus]
TISFDDDNISTASNYEEELIPYEIFNSNSHNSKDEDQEYISKFMIKLCIKEQNGIAFSAKRLSFNTQLCMEFHEEMQLQIQSLTNNFKLDQKDYILNKHAITKQKEVFIIATMLSNISTTSNKRKSKKSKVNKISNETSLDQSKRDLATIISILHEERFCNQCGTPCWPTDQGHIKLTGAHYTVWARSIINSFNDTTSPPNHSIFQAPPKPRGIKTNNASLEFTSPPYFIPMPQFIYSSASQTSFSPYQSFSPISQFSTSQY